MTQAQEQILESVITNRYTAAKASHAVGKTFVAAVAANWWYDCWEQHIVYVTAPTWKQCKGLTFKQIRKFRRERKLPGTILETGLIRDADKDLEPGHFIQALNAESGEGFQGEHTAPILIIVEEATGVPGYIFEAIKGLMTNPACRVLLIGNPTDEATPFGEACSSGNYNTLTISVLDHPNIIASLADEPPPFPDAVSLQWLEEMIEQECERVEVLEGDAFEFPAGSGYYYLPNATFQGRALGEFPTQADRQTIPRGWLKGLPVLSLAGEPRIGCDVARYGTDRTGIASGCGPCTIGIEEIRQFDNVAVAQALRDAAQELSDYLKRHGLDYDPKKIAMKIDITGGLGTGPYDMLKSEGYNVFGVNSGHTALDPEQFLNARSELWWTARERVKARRCDLSRVPEKMRDKLIKELSLPTWKPDTHGHRIVETKDKIKKRLTYSPDLADAWNLMNYAPLTLGQTYQQRFK